jgi:hypothetical protein
MNEETRRLVEEAEARAEKATPGPWRSMKPPYDRIVISDATKIGIGEFAVSVSSDLDTNDVAFIAHTRSDVPSLCATIRELNAHVEALEQARANERRAWREYVTTRNELVRLPVDIDAETHQKAHERHRSAVVALLQLGALDQ